MRKSTLLWLLGILIGACVVLSFCDGPTTVVIPEAEAHLWWNVVPNHMSKYCSGNRITIETREKVRKAQNCIGCNKFDRAVDQLEQLCQHMNEHPFTSGYRITHE